MTSKRKLNKIVNHKHDAANWEHTQVDNLSDYVLGKKFCNCLE